MIFINLYWYHEYSDRTNILYLCIYILNIIISKFPWFLLICIDTDITNIQTEQIFYIYVYIYIEYNNI